MLSYSSETNSRSITTAKQKNAEKYDVVLLYKIFLHPKLLFWINGLNKNDLIEQDISLCYKKTENLRTKSIIIIGFSPRVAFVVSKDGKLSPRTNHRKTHENPTKKVNILRYLTKCATFLYHPRYVL